jgi:hypothetical protein
MQSVEESQYDKINNAGTISDFNYADENGKTMTISNAMIQFNPSQVNLKKFNATIGKSDLSVTGVLENFMALFLRTKS